MTDKHSTDDVDFGGSNRRLTDAEKAQVPDLAQVAIAASATGAAYNVQPSSNALIGRLTSVQLPELLGKGTLVFSANTLADIMLGTVDNWRHNSIVNENPTLAAFLPNQPITVVTPLGDPDTMLFFTKMLSAMNENFRNTVSRSFLFWS